MLAAMDAADAPSDPSRFDALRDRHRRTLDRQKAGEQDGGEQHGDEPVGEDTGKHAAMRWLGAGRLASLSIRSAGIARLGAMAR